MHIIHGNTPRPQGSVLHIDPALRVSPPSPLPKGEQLRILSINLNSFNTQGGNLLKLSWDLALVQEARLIGDEDAYLELRKLGHACLLGSPDDSGKALLMAISRKGALQYSQSPDDPRVQHLLWQPTDASPIAITNVYGPADGSVTSLTYTSQLVGDSLANHVAKAPWPAFIVGDFNSESAQLSCAYSLNLAGWCDLSSGPTFFPSNGGTMRHIDHFWASPHAQSIVLERDTTFDYGFPGHAACVVTLSWGLPISYHKWVPGIAPPP